MKTLSSSKRYRPPLKWAGGKFRLLDHILDKLPKGERLVEPFIGSGAVFLNTDFDAYLLSDTNHDLIEFYRVLKKEGPQFTRYAKRYFHPRYNTEEEYYRLRELFNNLKPCKRKSALFLYLNRHAYNGLCRYNSSGKFNVPYGRYKNPYFPQQELTHFYAKSGNATFLCQSFTKTMQNVKTGDVLYCDPPYVPLSKSANFTQYTSSRFDEAEHLELAQQAQTLAKKNFPTLISNHNTTFTRQAYHNATLTKFKVQRFISANGKKRDHVSELLALFQ